MKFAPAIVFAATLFSAICRADFQLPGQISSRSVSGEFAVIGARQVSPLGGSFAVKTNAELIRLDPALLAVSAEHIKDSLWRRLGISDSPRRGQIFLVPHPAQSLDESIAIISAHFGDSWIYRVELPDIVSRARLMRALTGVTLLEFANRNATGHTAEIPEWLVDGFSQQLLEGIEPKIVSGPGKIVGGFTENSIVINDHAVQPLADAHRIFETVAPLTFEQLSWPTDRQLSGADGGVYRASAQLFTSDLLELDNGARNLRGMLESLPKFYNWQLAFRLAFQKNFPSPRDLEKWWALQGVGFVSHGGGGPQWTPQISREKLGEILSVPVDFRSASNNLPMHMEISLQAAIRNFSSERRDDMLRLKLRELELAQLQMAPQFAVLNDEYRRALAGFLEQNNLSWSKRPSSADGARTILKKLDALDARRYALETALDRPPMPALTGRQSHL